MVLFEKDGKLNLNFGKATTDSYNTPANFSTYKDSTVHAFVGSTDLGTYTPPVVLTTAKSSKKTTKTQVTEEVEENSNSDAE